MDELKNNPDYKIRWPEVILGAQIDRLIKRSLDGHLDETWHKEVATLLTQAFRSSAPESEFTKRWYAASRQAVASGDEPF